MFTRIAIVNRGEPAARLIRAARELAAEWSVDLRTIALHTAAEAGAMFVSHADEAVRIGARGGEGSADEQNGAAPANPYLDYGELERALLEARADAVWPGWGFVAEHPGFAELCRSLGMVFVGPDADVMRRVGDKVGAKQLAEKSGVPVAPWSRGAVETLDEAREQAASIGYPLAIKATAGGGGRGIRTVSAEAELEDAFERARAEAQRSFGDATVLLERVLPDARHIEVQIAADDAGGVWALGVRDCSIQRRKQKVIEESSSTALTADQDEHLRTAAADLARTAGYRGVGTVEFLYQPAEGIFTFLEVNPRLQVEHPVTELTTGQDLVKLQLHLAAGGTLDGAPPPSVGHAIEARLNAEDPDRGFAPAPGTVELLTLPAGPGVRVDTGIAEGDEIPPEYDSMIAKVMAWGRDRAEALARLRRAVAETSVVVRGGTTNKGFLLDLLDRPEVRSGDVHTGWLDARDSEVPGRRADVGLLVAAVDAYDADAALDRSRLYQSAARGRPQTQAQPPGAGSPGSVAELRHRGQGYELEVAQLAPSHYLVSVDGHSIDVRLERLRRFEARVSVDDRTFRVLSRIDGVDRLVEVDGIEHRFSPDEGGIVRAPSPAMVIAINVAPDEIVEAGTSLAALESMKMELPVPAPVGGRVREVLVTPNVQVAAGEPLLRLEPAGDEDADASLGASSDRVAFGELARTPAAGDPRLRALECVDLLRSLVMGFDVGAAHARQATEEYQEHRRRLPVDDPALLRAELGTLRIFADLCELSRNRRAADQEESGQTRSPREHLHAYLRSVDVEAEGIPAHFQAKLRRALAHYGVHDLERTQLLEEAAYRMFRAVQSQSAQIPALRGLLETQLDATTLPEALDEELRETLERVIAATQLRYPLIGDLARSVRYRRFDAPLIERTGEEAFAAMRDDLAYLAAHPDAPDYAARIERLVAHPQPLVRLLADRAGEHDVGPHDPMLEILTRRFYRARQMQQLRPLAVDGLQLVVGEYAHDRERAHVLTTLTAASQLRGTADAIATAVREVSSSDPVLVDIYAWSDQPDADPDELASHVGTALDRAGLPPTTERVAVVITGRDAAGRSDTEAYFHQFTFRHGVEGFREDRATRGLHPMIAERLELWRLANFAIERLPSAEDTYLFHCVAHDNPDDERLIALADVRDLTPERDASGRMTALPELEHVLGTCLEAIRRAHAERPPERRLHWNRVMLYVWPQVEAPLDELIEVARGLVPLTEGLGLEEVQARGRLPQPPDGELREKVLHLSSQPGAGLTVRLTDPPTTPLAPLDEYTQKVLECRRRGQVYPFQLLGTLTRPHGETVEGGSFTEYDLDDNHDNHDNHDAHDAHDAHGNQGRLVPVSRPYGQNSAGIIVGLLRTPTKRYPEGIARVVLFGDPTKALGSLAEPECRRVMAALDLAAELGVPIDWFALSSGAKIAMDSGSENMDWVAAALRRLVQFTQLGGEVNVVAAGINVGAQPYWNAEATMLMHTRGILVMTPESAMVLTGKQALDFSGGVSAEDNVGIGGYERVMGPNGQAQYWVPDVTAACELLADHHEHGYVAPGERFPRRAQTEDPVERDVRDEPHVVEGSEFTRVGDIFSDATNPERKKPFDMRVLMRAVADRDHRSLERWSEMADAETAAPS